MTEVEMRDGSVVEDVRLGRLKSFSPKSRNFLLAERLEAEELDDKPLRSYTWNPSITLDQNGWGGCVSWTLSYELDAPPKKVRGETNLTALRRYFRIQDRDEFAGSERPGDTPQGAGTSMRAGGDQMVAEGHFGRFDWADFDDPVKATRQILTALAYRGPVPLGIDWLSGMDRPDGDGFIHATGRLRGGHSILAVGLSLKRRAVKLKQSWNTPAYWLLSFDDVTTLMDRDGEAYSPTRQKVA